MELKEIASQIRVIGNGIGLGTLQPLSADALLQNLANRIDNICDMALAASKPKVVSMPIVDPIPAPVTIPIAEEPVKPTANDIRKPFRKRN